MHNQADRKISRQLLCPPNDVSFSVVVQIAFMEGRGIKSIEELRKLANPHLNDGYSLIAVVAITIETHHSPSQPQYPLAPR
jgi:hypothetical protein